ncbi:hypothetical protein VTN96DRAFT_7834 [Rasamsonia emersonii]
MPPPGQAQAWKGARPRRCFAYLSPGSAQSSQQTPRPKQSTHGSPRLDVASWRLAPPVITSSREKKKGYIYIICARRPSPVLSLSSVTALISLSHTLIWQRSPPGPPSSLVASALSLVPSYSCRGRRAFLPCDTLIFVRACHRPCSVSHPFCLRLLACISLD